METILTNVLIALYQPFGFSILLAFCAMFFYLYAYNPANAGNGWKSAIVTWYKEFKESVFFRKLFLLAFVSSLILFRTLLNRNLWQNPLYKKILKRTAKFKARDAEPIVQCDGRLGYLGDSKRGKAADN